MFCRTKCRVSPKDSCRRSSNGSPNVRVFDPPRTTFDETGDESVVKERESWYSQFMTDYETHLSDEEMKTLLMDYFVSEGFEEAAKTLAEELGHEFDSEEFRESARLSERNALRDAVHKGDLDKAIALINEMCPHLLESDKALKFDILRQKLVELIRNQQVEEALNFSETHLTYALLAFTNPEASPFGYLMHSNQRMCLASQINAAILEEFESVPFSRLELLKRQMVWNCVQGTGPVNIEHPLDARLTQPIARDLFGDREDGETPAVDDSLSP
ncbi:LisH [Aphelenchoides fujianensis]|nr:LisH [Aphelenchoides fujianensis]